MNLSPFQIENTVLVLPQSIARSIARPLQKNTSAAGMATGPWSPCARSDCPRRRWSRKRPRGFACRCAPGSVRPAARHGPAIRRATAQSLASTNTASHCGIGRGQRIQKRLGRRSATRFRPAATPAAPRPAPPIEASGAAIRLTPMPMARCATPCPAPGAFQQDPRHLAAVQQHIIRPFQREGLRQPGQRHKGLAAAPAPPRRTAAPPARRVPSAASAGSHRNCRAGWPRAAPAARARPSAPTPETTRAPSATGPDARHGHWCCQPWPGRGAPRPAGQSRPSRQALAPPRPPPVRCRTG